MSLDLALLNHEQRDEITELCAGFTCFADLDTKETRRRIMATSISAEASGADADEVGVTRTWLAIYEGDVAGYIALAVAGAVWELTVGYSKGWDSVSSTAWRRPPGRTSATSAAGPLSTRLSAPGAV